MLIISAEFTAKPENREAVITACKKLIPLSNAEDGCISYEFFEDTEQKNHFFFFERWKDMDAINIHMDMPYLKAHGKIFPDLVIEGTTKVEIHEVTNTKRLV
ncbi:MAG: antibiotic biosynthesis monooxygenase [Alphaproteobacteria bacterium]|nr:antibiotic biosynthesis monooxygenase [Alphaproteobacteria bacterium]